jgi:hypothetical protein
MNSNHTTRTVRRAGAAVALVLTAALASACGDQTAPREATPDPAAASSAPAPDRGPTVQQDRPTPTPHSSGDDHRQPLN